MNFGVFLIFSSWIDEVIVSEGDWGSEVGGKLGEFIILEVM